MEDIQSESLNGWQNIGRVIQWIRKHHLSGSDLIIYTEVASKTVGYSQYTSEPTSVTDLTNTTSLGRTTVIKSLKSLIEKKFILRPKSNVASEQFKSAYRYQLNMKLDGFPSLGKLAKNKETNTLGSLTTNSNNIFNYDNKIHESYDGVLIQLDNLKGIQRQIAQKHNRIIEKEKTNETVIF